MWDHCTGAPADQPLCAADHTTPTAVPSCTMPTSATTGHTSSRRAGLRPLLQSLPRRPDAVVYHASPASGPRPPVPPLAVVIAHFPPSTPRPCPHSVSFSAARLLPHLHMLLPATAYRRPWCRKPPSGTIQPRRRGSRGTSPLLPLHPPPSVPITSHPPSSARSGRHGPDLAIGAIAPATPPAAERRMGEMRPRRRHLCGRTALPAPSQAAAARRRRKAAVVSPPEPPGEGDVRGVGLFNGKIHFPR